MYSKCYSKDIKAPGNVNQEGDRFVTKRLTSDGKFRSTPRITDLSTSSVFVILQKLLLTSDQKEKSKKIHLTSVA